RLRARRRACRRHRRRSRAGGTWRDSSESASERGGAARTQLLRLALRRRRARRFHRWSLEAELDEAVQQELLGVHERGLPRARAEDDHEELLAVAPRGD